MTVKAIEQLRAKLKSIGASLDDTSDYTLQCDAPAGYVWASIDCMAYPIHYATNSQSWLAQAIRDELPSLKMGLRKVTGDELAECKHLQGDDQWQAGPDAPDFIAWPK